MQQTRCASVSKSKCHQVRAEIHPNPKILFFWEAGHILVWMMSVNVWYNNFVKLYPIYFVSYRKRPWRHSACRRINAAKRSICASIPGRVSFLNAWENTDVTRAITSVLFCTTRWRHGRSRGETKYSIIQFMSWTRTAYLNHHKRCSESSA